MKVSFSLKTYFYLLIAIATFLTFSQEKVFASEEREKELTIHFKAFGRHIHDLVGTVIFPDKEKQSYPVSTRIKRCERGVGQAGTGKVKILAPAPEGIYYFQIERKDGKKLRHLDSSAVTIVFPDGEEQTFYTKFFSREKRKIRFSFHYKPQSGKK